MTRDDKELLELAAKAAGVPIYESTDGSLQRRPIWVVKCGGGMGTMPYEEEWNPLKNDGDALRLAVGLALWIFTPDIDDFKVHVRRRDDKETVAEKVLDNPLAATRRAIVRAAAEIGRNMT
jgi:hypothetical protein